MSKRRFDNGGTHSGSLYLCKEEYWSNPHREGMGSSLPSSERMKHWDSCCGIHGQARGRRGAKKFASSRRRVAERELLRTATSQMDEDDE